MHCDICNKDVPHKSCEFYNIEICHEGGYFKRIFCAECYDIVKGFIDEMRFEDSESDYKFPYIEGQFAKMLVDGVWHKGKIVNGYRFRDGIVTIENDEGKRYWCGEERTELYKPL